LVPVATSESKRDPSREPEAVTKADGNGKSPNAKKKRLIRGRTAWGGGVLNFCAALDTQKKSGFEGRRGIGFTERNTHSSRKTRSHRR